jgi:hypothetical protein
MLMKLLSAGAAKILVNFINQKGVQGVLYGLLIILRLMIKILLFFTKIHFLIMIFCNFFEQPFVTNVT